MTEIEEIQYLIDLDQEFDKIHKEAIRCTNSIFDDEAEDLVNLRNIYFPSWPIKEFFARYKVIMGWSAMMGQVLQKIHGKKSTDFSALRPISGTDYGYIIYHDPQPWRVRVWLARPAGETRIRVTVVVRLMPSKAGGQTSKLADTRYADIEFSLDRPAILVGSVSGTAYPNLLGSKMTVRLYEKETDKIIHEESLLVKDFKPSVLDQVLRTAFNI